MPKLTAEEANHGRRSRAEKAADPKYATRTYAPRKTADALSPTEASARLDARAATARQGSFMDLDQFAAAYLDDASSVGYLKICPAEREHSAFFYFKFNRGAYKGHYVVVVADYADPAYALWLLGGKIDAVLAGNAKPIKDTYPV